MTNPWGSGGSEPVDSQVPWHTPDPSVGTYQPTPPAGVTPGAPVGMIPGMPAVAPHATYSAAAGSPAETITHIRWLAGGGWPPEAIAMDLSLRGYPTLGGKLPFIGDSWRPYMVKRIIAGEAPSSTAAMLSGLCAWLINPFLLASVASVILFVQARREIRASEGQLSGGGKAAAGLVLGLLAGTIFVGVIVLSIVLQSTVNQL